MSVRQFLNKHGIELPNGQWFITKPIFGYKKVYTYVSSRRKLVPENLEPWVQPRQDIHLFSGSTHKSQLESVSRVLTKVRSSAKKSFYEKDLYLRTEGVANLVIPPGSIVNPGFSENYESEHIKFRSSMAICDSVYGLHDELPRAFGVSIHDNSFMYTSLKSMGSIEPLISRRYVDPDKMNYDWHPTGNSHPYIITPKNAMNPASRECASGIHFYLSIYGVYSHNQ